MMPESHHTERVGRRAGRAERRGVGGGRSVAAWGHTPMAMAAALDWPNGLNKEIFLARDCAPVACPVSCEGVSCEKRMVERYGLRLRKMVKIPVWWRRAVLPSLPWVVSFLSFFLSEKDGDPQLVECRPGTLSVVKVSVLEQLVRLVNPRTHRPWWRR